MSTPPTPTTDIHSIAANQPAPDQSRAGGRLRRLAAAATLTTLAAGAVLAVSALAPAVAGATNPMPHNPIGKIGSITATTNGVEIVGWAADPDEPTTDVTVAGLVDGRPVGAKQATDETRPDISKKYGLGKTPGFDLTVPVPKGAHTVCLNVRNLDQGESSLLRCVATPLGTHLSSTQIAAHSPVGAIMGHNAHGNRVTVKGWTSDPDSLLRRSVVVLYVDGSPAKTLTTVGWRSRNSGPRPTGAGRRSAFTASVPVTAGAHVGCIWVVNVGLGSNSFLGCRTMDTRGPAGTTPVAEPKLNKEVLAEARKHIGQAYVWGATGPKTFDCSGLVMYSYGKFGYTTPRTSEEQYAAARLIPASQAVPGDLVFYHNSVGDVYHVGIYAGPGKSVAAIDTAEGVNWQHIYGDNTTVSYGSFTHD